MEKSTPKMEEHRTWKNPLGKWQTLLIIWKILPLTGRTSFKNEISPPLGHSHLEHDL
jgi:hypothetical protein